jgi:hypothetical protein
MVTKRNITTTNFRGWFLRNVCNNLPGYMVMVEDLRHGESYF